MKVLFESLYTLFAPAGAKPALHTALAGQMYLTEAPQNTSYPYAVYNMIANDYDWMFTEDLEEFLIQFSIFDDKASATNVTGYFDDLKTLYDWAVPVVTGYQSVWMIREFAELLRIDDIWHYIVQYRVLLKKT
jgi:hypothetical protein